MKGRCARCRSSVPSSERVVTELVVTGGSAIVDRAVAARRKRGEVEKRGNSARLSQPPRDASRARRAAAGIDRLDADYLGDLQMHSTCSDGAESIADLAEAALRWAGSGSASPIIPTVCRSRTG